MTPVDRVMSSQLEAILAAIVACGTTAMVALMAILISRMIKTRRDVRSALLRDEFQKTLNALIILELSQDRVSNSSFIYYLRIFRQRLNSSLGKQQLTNVLITNKQNLKGSSTLVIRKIYVRLHLKKFSRAKLHGFNLTRKVQGMQELAEMECMDVLPDIQQLFTHRSRIVRQESFIAAVRLSIASPFVLVDHYVDAITPWMQVTIHKHLATLPAEKLPKFYRWFYSANKEIKKFAIVMTLHFRQLEAISHAAHLLSSQDLELAGLAAHVLGELGAEDYADEVAQLGWQHVLHEPLSHQVIGALENIGDGSRHGELLAWQMIHGSHAIRFQAMHAMQKLNLRCQDYLVDFDGMLDDDFEKIQKHLNDPFLRS